MAEGSGKQELPRRPPYTLKDGLRAAAAAAAGGVTLISLPMCNSEKSGNEQEEVKLQNASKEIVQTAIQQAMQQVTQEGNHKENKPESNFSAAITRSANEDARKEKMTEFTTSSRVL